MDDLLNQAPCGYVSFRDDGTIVEANATLGEMLGVNPETLRGRSIETVLTLPSSMFYQTHFFPLLKMSGKVEEIYLTLRMASGDLPVLANAVRRERDGAAVCECIVVSVRQRGEFEDAILRAKRKAEAATRDRERALAQLESAHQLLEANREELAALNARLKRAMTETHHRVKNNLQVIHALIEMQVTAGREQVPVTALSGIAASVRALGAIHDLLTGEAKTRAAEHTVSSQVLFERLIGLVTQMSSDREIHAHLQDVRLTSRQATGLALITSELVSNALKHSAEDVWISFSCSESSATLEVRDRGPGFSPDFDPLVAANTGLELIDSMTRWDLGGEVIYANVPGGGAAVTIRFPLQPSPQGH